MSLTRPRRLTAASLAARRANALKSTGPRTVRGKARVGFNALKLGLHAARSARLRDRLIRAGYDRQEALYGQIRSRIAQTFEASTPEQRSWCDRLATQVWCLALRPQARRLFARTKLKNYRKQMAWMLRTSSHQQIGGEGDSDNRAGNSDTPAPGGNLEGGRLNFGIRDPWNRIGLRFWVQRKRYWTLARLRRMLSGETGAAGAPEAAPTGTDDGSWPGWPCHVVAGAEEPAPPGPHEGLERAVRSRAFRLAKPGAIERYRYSLMPNGDPDWEREPWKSTLDLRRAAEVKTGGGRRATERSGS